MKVTIVDVGISNVRSVVNSINIVGHACEIVTDPSGLKNSSIIVLPGVGSFSQAIRNFKHNDLFSIIQNMANDTKILGICLGMQLLFDGSYEFGWTDGFGIIPGTVNRLPETSPSFKVPNVGWCAVEPTKPSILFPQTDQGIRQFYHVHSYFASCERQEDVVGTIKFDDKNICVAVQRGHIYGVQFHPEKSQDAGLDLLARVIES